VAAFATPNAPERVAAVLDAALRARR